MEVHAVGKQKIKSGGVQTTGAMERKNSVEKKQRQTRVKVVIRVRPPLASGTTDSQICVSTSENKVNIINHRNVKENLEYGFSSVFNKTCGQREVFETCVRPLLGHALKGENVAIFAYGPTGAGKTYTMMGTENDPGMIPRVIHTLFQGLQPPASTSGGVKVATDHTVSFSFLEIYNEKVQDLLNPSECDLPIREDCNHNIFVAGLTEKVIKNFEDFKNLFGPASNNRTMATTKLNNRSSRSHCIVQLKVDTRSGNQVHHGKVYLIDLAGSEDNRRTGNSGIRLKESGAINKSLFVLGEVVDAINNNLPRIPYRNSKLTRLLQDSIGGSCHSVMITNVAPEVSYYYDTYCTLNFATKSRKIVNTNTTTTTLDQSAEAPQKTHKRSMAGEAGRPAKKAKLSGSNGTSPLSIVDMELCGPLVKRQDHLEREVKGCVAKMETLVEQIHLKCDVKKHGRPHTPTTAARKDDAATLKQIQSQLLQVQSQLQELQKEQTQQKGQMQQKGQITHVVPERRRSKRMEYSRMPNIDKILEDKTNTSKPREKAAKPREKAAKPMMSHVWSEEVPSCSPLFVAPPSSLTFNKGFKSTACRGPVAPRTPHKFKADAANFSGQQKKQNEEFLVILNSAPVKRLQELHTVGAKRARLIFDWRQAHGHFTSFDDLREIPGFTEKSVHSLLQRNFVLADD